MPRHPAEFWNPADYKFCEQVLACLEGDYSSYSLKWKVSLNASESDWNMLLRADETVDKLFIRSMNVPALTIRTLSDGTFESRAGTLNDPYELMCLNYSLTRRYFAFVVDEGGVPKLKIYKDGSLLQTIDLSVAPVSWTQTTTVYTLSVSSNGKYVFVENTNADEYALFEGS